MKKCILSLIIPAALVAFQGCGLKDSLKETLYDNSIEGDVWYADDDINLSFMNSSTPKTFILEKSWKDNCDLQVWNGRKTDFYRGKGIVLSDTSNDKGWIMVKDGVVTIGGFQNGHTYPLNGKWNITYDGTKKVYLKSQEGDYHITLTYSHHNTPGPPKKSDGAGFTI